MTALFRSLPVFAALCVASAAQTCSAGAADQLVQTVLKAPVIVGISTYEKQARLLGDCVAQALASNLRLKDIQNPETGAAVVKLLGQAFSVPSPDSSGRGPATARRLASAGRPR